MGKRGPTPTPTRKLKLRGSWRANARRQEPQPEPKAPPRPATLSPEAAAVWDELLPPLEAAGMLARFDGRAFARYCELSAVWDELLAFVRKSGHAHAVKNARGQVTGVRPYPQVRLMLQVNEVLLRLEGQYGLTPTARVGMTAREPYAARSEAFEHYFRPARPA